ncbi:MAG TPA: DUF6249 domain-containing protein [Vicinamibacterales bacterium]|nr:DUF6249 domain-containing protein [Vicinamibacterales bacterium]HEX2442779.1 DUF6249 domain-containing protein [Vicinamibacterales bacterium]
MEPELVLMAVSFAMITGAVIVFIISAIQRGKLREMAHRERLAMIERGVAPPPEVDPGRFERALGQPAWDEEVAARAARYRRIGVIFMGLGAALWFIITFAGDAPEEGFGVGGAVVVLGAALYINSQLELKHAPPRRSSTSKNTGTLEP